MSLATRCPACGTIFRVVQDQLKVSEGWVRCGQCHEVFHGIEQLFDLDSDPTIAARRAAARSQGTSNEDSVPGFAPTRTPPIGAMRRPAAMVPPPPSPPPPLPPPPPATRRFSPPPVPAAPAPAVANARGQVLPPVVPARPPEEPPAAAIDFDFNDDAGIAGVLVDDDAAEAARPPSSPPPPPQPPAEPVAAEPPAPLEATAPTPIPRRASRRIPPPPSPQDAVSTMPSRLVDDEGPETLASMLPEAPGDWPPRKRKSSRSAGKDRAKAAREASARSREIRVEEPVDIDDPRFLREARRAAFWDAPAMRAGLLVALVLLTIGAVGQVAFPLRDTIAARWPVTAPALEWACEQAGCTLQAPRALASLALDGSTLTRTETDHVLLFSADLRNRAAWPVRMPAFDLKFTDMGGQVVARRVFEPADLGIGAVSLAPDTEMHVRARLKLDGIEVVGFQAEVFYP